MKSSLLNQAIEKGAKLGGIHVGVAVVSVAPEVRMLIREKITPLYLKLQKTEYFPVIWKFLDEMDCIPEPEDQYDGIEFGA